ncbi:neuferricin isoform X2 [Sitophilus oryzae]|uniref:Neuferricin isoform X2 n=1 Tax=Sitophilus oryzae TaxID=7048 RepID=A0A6J2X6Y6_SITOR|nr:neuferricin isoform X2 [Sitophilus oryzae]
MWKSVVNQRKNEKKKYVLLTAEELSQYDGVHQPFLYLSILGIIFNVTEGKKHYGVGKQYNFFVGKDASRSFVTGKFNDNDASDDVGGLSLQELQSLNNWLKFYSKDYQEVGKLVGRYYNELGELTPYAKQIKKLILEAEDVEKNSQLEKIQFPPCNIEWSAEKGSRVWCTTRSGGIQRSWTGKPRQYYEPGSKTYRCACINEENEKLGVIKEYPHCNKNSESCYVNL